MKIKLRKTMNLFKKFTTGVRIPTKSNDGEVYGLRYIKETGNHYLVQRKKGEKYQPMHINELEALAHVTKWQVSSDLSKFLDIKQSLISQFLMERSANDISEREYQTALWIMT